MSYTFSMPFTDEQPFLDAIFARYYHDEPRFIYADFLDDSGDPERAELVRVQVALAHMADDDPRYAELINQQAELLVANRSRWCEFIGDLVLEEQCEFRRGVLDSVVLDASAFLEKGAELLGRVFIRRICLRDSAAVMPSLITSELLANVRELSLFGDNIGNGGVNLLVRSPFLKDLENLDLGFNGIDDAGVRALAKASTLPNLNALSLSANGRITSAGIEELAASPFFGGLTSLDVFGNDIDESGVGAIVSSKTLAMLHTLRLSENHIGDAGISTLAKSPLLGRMLTRSSRLEIRKNEIGPAGIAILAGTPAVSGCTSLDLNHNEIGDPGLAAILRSTQLRSLKILRVSHNHITDSVVDRLKDVWASAFAQLHFLDLSENKLTNYGCGKLELSKKGFDVSLDLKRNNQASAGGETPVSVGDLVQGVLQGVSQIVDNTAELRRRVSHPSMRAGERPNPRG